MTAASSPSATPVLHGSKGGLPPQCTHRRDRLHPGNGAGYYLVASDGGIFTFGDAAFHGSEGAPVHLNKPIVGIAADAQTGGYWMVASDGGIFAFAYAPFYGSKGGHPLNKPGGGHPARHPRPRSGYWLDASDGGIFSFGERRLLRVDAGGVQCPRRRGRLTRRESDSCVVRHPLD